MTMKTKPSAQRRPNHSIETEFEVRLIDAHGDAFDVDQHDTQADALAAANAADLTGETKAVVVERHTCRRPAHHFALPDERTVIHVRGDGAALVMGGWSEGDPENPPMAGLTVHSVGESEGIGQWPGTMGFKVGVRLSRAQE